jgi:transcriptional regulator with XRE-family HTH domain
MNQKKDDIDFPRCLRDARKLRGLTLQELSKKSGIYGTSIAKFETGARLPTVINLRRLALALNVSANFLLGIKRDPALVDIGEFGGHDLLSYFQRLSSADMELAQSILKILAERNSQ